MTSYKYCHILTFGQQILTFGQQVKCVIYDPIDKIKQKETVLQREHSKHGKTINKYKMFNVKAGSKHNNIRLPHSHGKLKTKNKETE